MNDNNEFTSKVRRNIDSWRDIIDLSTTTSERMTKLLENDELTFSNDILLVFYEISELLQVFLNFSEKHTEIANSIASLNQVQLEKYFTDLLAGFKANEFLNFVLKSICNQIIGSNSVSHEAIHKLQSVIPKITNFFNDLIIKANRLEIPVALNPHVAPIIPQSTTKSSTPDSFKIDILQMERSKEVQDAFNQYIEISKCTDPEEKVFKKLFNEISEIPLNCAKVSSFASIVGPSLMGKTQFAFSLARVRPVIYVNFASNQSMQDIYETFENISSAFIQCLLVDIGTLRSENIELDSDKIFRFGLDCKLKSIGLLWNFVKYSAEFDGTLEWFEFYVKARTIKFEKMSPREFLDNLKSLIAQDKNFIPPIVFIDELDSLSMAMIKLLRNLCRILGLPVVLASTSAKVNNLLNITSAMAPKDNGIWVHAIRALPQANLTAIFQVLQWSQFADQNNELNLPGLLSEFDVKYDKPEELENLKNLLFIMKKQSETCLQGVALIVYMALKEELTKQSGKQLDVKSHLEAYFDLFASETQK